MSSKAGGAKVGQAKSKILKPTLRFPEFSNTEGWEEVVLGEIADVKLGKMLDSKKHTTGTLLPYLSNLSVRWNEVDTSNLPKMYFDDDELVRFGLQAGDVVVCEGGEPGRSAVWDGRLPNIKFQKAIHRVRFHVPFKPHLLVLYLELIAGTPLFEKLFTGGGIKHLTGETFAQLKIPLAPHAEQQKIADCLSSLDDLIAAQTQKLDALKSHKKRLMQQLFPAEGETTPKLRFSVFRDSRDWELKILSDLSSCNLSNGVFNDPKKVGSGYKLVNVLDMYIESTIREDRLSLVGISDSEFAKNKVENGDIFFTRSSLVKSGIAYSNIYLGNSNDITFDGHLIRFRPNKEVIVPVFMHYILKSDFIRKQLVARGKTATMTTIGQSDVGTVELSVPHVGEQQRIADCLSSVDELIAAQTQTIDRLRNLKKGLMQQLFPDLQEIKK